MSKNMSCVNVIHYVSRMDRAGQETLIMNIFRNIDRKRVNFEFLCSEQGKGDYDDEIISLGGKIHHIQLNRISGKMKQLDNRRILCRYLKSRNQEIQVFHIHTQHAMDAYLAATAALHAGIPKVIVHSHNTSAQLHLFAHKVFKILLNTLPITRFACGVDAGKWMFGSTKNTVIHNAVDLDCFTFDEVKRKQVREQMHWEDQIIVGHVGRFNIQKNHSYLIDIFRSLHASIPESRLVLVGQGELEPEIREKVSSLGLDDAVSFLGIRADMELLYQGMDIFLLPSLYEGLPVVLVETQAEGLPCFISDTITREIDIIPNLFRLAIDVDAADWSKKISEYLSRGISRQKTDSYMKKAGYDIKLVAKELEGFYTLQS